MSRLLKSWAIPPGELADAFHLLGLPQLLLELPALGDVRDRALDDDFAGLLVGEQRGILERPGRSTVFSLAAHLVVGEAARTQQGVEEILALPGVGVEDGHVAVHELLARGVPEDAGEGVVAFEDASDERHAVDAGQVALEEEPVSFLRLAHRLLRPLALEGDRDLLRDEGEDFLFGLAEREARVVTLDDEDAEGLPAAFQRDAEPRHGVRAHQLDLAALEHRREVLVEGEQRLAGAQDVGGQPVARRHGLGRGVDLVHAVGVRDQVGVRVVQRDVEVLRVHELADDGVDRPVELVDVLGRARRRRDAVERRLQLLGPLALRDVDHAAPDEPLRGRRKPGQAHFARDVPAEGIPVDPLEQRRLAVQRAADVLADGVARAPSVRLQGSGERERILLEEVGAGVAPEARGVVVGLDEPAGVDVEDDDRLRGVLDLRPVAGLALLQGFLGASAVGDVDDGADVALEGAFRREARHPRVEHPAVLAVVAAQPVLVLVRQLALLELVEAPHERRGRRGGRSPASRCRSPARASAP